MTSPQGDPRHTHADDDWVTPGFSAEETDWLGVADQQIDHEATTEQLERSVPPTIDLGQNHENDAYYQSLFGAPSESDAPPAPTIDLQQTAPGPLPGQPAIPPVAPTTPVSPSIPQPTAPQPAAPVDDEVYELFRTGSLSQQPDASASGRGGTVPVDQGTSPPAAPPPRRPDAQYIQLVNQGRQAVTDGDSNTAYKYFRQATTLYPDQYHAWWYRARAANNRAERQYCVERVLDLKPDHPDALKFQAQTGSAPRRGRLRSCASVTLLVLVSVFVLLVCGLTGILGPDLLSSDSDSSDRVSEQADNKDEPDVDSVAKDDPAGEAPPSGAFARQEDGQLNQPPVVMPPTASPTAWPTWTPIPTATQVYQPPSPTAIVYVVTATPSYTPRVVTATPRIDPRVVTATPTGCDSNLPPRLEVGQAGRVLPLPPIPNRLRAEPNTSSRILGEIEPGHSFMVLDGPECRGGIAFWYVRANTGTGWTAEGSTYYYVEPLN